MYNMLFKVMHIYLTLVNVGKMLPDITNHCNIENHNLVIFGSACSYKVKGIITWGWTIGKARRPSSYNRDPTLFSRAKATKLDSNKLVLRSYFQETPKSPVSNSLPSGSLGVSLFLIWHFLLLILPNVENYNIDCWGYCSYKGKGFFSL